MAKIVHVLVMLGFAFVQSESHARKEYRQDGSKCCSTDPKKPSNNCEQTTLAAKGFIQAVITPGYPNGLPEYRQCTWTIQSRPGKRVRVDFRDFYLVGPNQEGQCQEQFVVVMSSKRYKMGPFCGNTGLQAMVSPDNLLVVQLETQASMSKENYRGFRMEFRETEETPNPELRPPNWSTGADMFLVGSQLQQAISQFSPRKGNQNPTTTSLVSGTRTAPRPASMSSMSQSHGTVKRGGTKGRLPAGVPVGHPNRGANFHYYGPSQNMRFKVPGNMHRSRKVETTSEKITGAASTYLKNYDTSVRPSKSRLPLSIETIAGIAVGGVVLIALVILIVCKARQRTSSKAETGKAEADSNNDAYAIHSTKSEKLASPSSNVGEIPNMWEPSPPMYPYVFAPSVPTHIPPGAYAAPNVVGSFQHNQVSQQTMLSPPLYNYQPASSEVKQPVINATEQQQSSHSEMPWFSGAGSNMLLFDPSTGTYYDPNQAQVCQNTSTIHQPYQNGSSGYFTMPYSQQSTEFNGDPKVKTVGRRSGRRSGRKSHGKNPHKSKHSRSDQKTRSQRRRQTKR